MTDGLTLRHSLHHIDVGAKWALPFKQLQRYDPPGRVDDAGETRRAANMLRWST
jgi:hypothetical protein